MLSSIIIGKTYKTLVILPSNVSSTTPQHHKKLKKQKSKHSLLSRSIIEEPVPLVQLPSKFSFTDLAQESFTSALESAAGSRNAKAKTPESSVADRENHYNDTDKNARILPETISEKTANWVRLQTLVDESTELKMYQLSDSDSSDPNKDFSFSSLNQDIPELQRISQEISALYLYKNSLTVGKNNRLINASATIATNENEEQVELLKPKNPWKPWLHIFSETPAFLNQSAKGKGAPSIESSEEINNLLNSNDPKINNYGKYVVRLFFMGEWRKIIIDDFVPVDDDGRVLLPMTRVETKVEQKTILEAWPLLLTKALLKIWASTAENIDEIPMFHPIQCLTGFMPRTFQENFWEMLVNEEGIAQWYLDSEKQEDLPKGKLVIVNAADSSVLMSQLRQCPLKEPEPLIDIPKWKLIRPTKEIQDIQRRQEAPPRLHRWIELSGSGYRKRSVKKLSRLFYYLINKKLNERFFLENYKNYLD